MQIKGANCICCVWGKVKEKFSNFHEQSFLNFFNCEQLLSHFSGLAYFFFLETSCTICFASILVINLQFLLPFLQFWWIYRPACPTVLFNSNLFVELWYTVTDLLQTLLTKFRFERARFIRKFMYVVWTNVRVYEVFSWLEQIRKNRRPSL